MSNFIKIRPVGADLFHADGRTDMMKLMATFRNFVNAPKTSVPTSQKTHMAPVQIPDY